MDLGPHRFFSKSDRVMKWWTNIMPLHPNGSKEESTTIHYQNKSKIIDQEIQRTFATDKNNPPAKSMLILPRLTRIYFLRQFFNYPIQLTATTLRQLGLIMTIKISFSYLYAKIFPRKPEKTLEDFMINRFGMTLYRLFFKDYTEKVWGLTCDQISAEWGAQRIKGVSLSKAIIHSSKSLIRKKKDDISQKGTETSLIEQFLYPAKGAGAMWEEVARNVEAMGGKILSNRAVKQIFPTGNMVTSVEVQDTKTGFSETFAGDYFFSTMPVKELISAISATVPEDVKTVAEGLVYRDFIYTGILVKKVAISNLKDNWIYIQEKKVNVARIQIYNNWGPYMVRDRDTVWLGLEYFCSKGDHIWNLSDKEIKKMAVDELAKMKLIQAEDVIDSTVERMEKTYPSYTGSYNQFHIIRDYLDRYSNLFLVGRNGMHKYNNADHSMLTAMTAVDNILANTTNKQNIWDINTEQEYQE